MRKVFGGILYLALFTATVYIEYKVGTSHTGHPTRAHLAGGMFVIAVPLIVATVVALAKGRDHSGGGESRSAWEQAPKVSRRTREYQGW